MAKKTYKGYEVVKKLGLENKEDPYKMGNVHPESFKKAGYRLVAWTGRIKSLYYNPNKDIMVQEFEGDYYITKNPSDKELQKAYEKFPIAEVAVEKWDNRF